MICFDYYCGNCAAKLERIVLRGEKDSQVCYSCEEPLTRLLTFSESNSRPHTHAFPAGYWESAGRHFSCRRELEDYIDRSGEEEGDHTKRREAPILDGFRGKPRRVSVGEGDIHGGTPSKGGDASVGED